METIMDMIRHVVVFLLLASMVSNLLVEQEYRKYISFATGLIVMVMVLVPVLSLMGKDQDWKDYLIEADYQQRAEGTRKEIEMFGEQYEERIKKELIEEADEDGANQKSN